MHNFWRSLDLPLINCEIEPDWSKEYIIYEIPITSRNGNSLVPEVEAIQTTCATLQINDTKLYIPVVTLLINGNIKFLENVKQGFK